MFPRSKNALVIASLPSVTQSGCLALFAINAATPSSDGVTDDTGASDDSDTDQAPGVSGETGPTLSTGPTGETGPSGPTGPTASSGPAPVLFFTDITAGPNAGGRNAGGAYLTIFGENFGSTQGTVTIGGVAISRYFSWGSNNAIARDLDRIVVQLTQDLAVNGTTPQDIVVTVDGRSSNTLPFYVLDASMSRIFWVDAANPSRCASDTCTGCAGPSGTSGGTLAAPFERPAMLRCKMAAGDIAYLLPGDYTQGADSSAQSVLSITAGSDPGSISGFQTTLTRPLAIVGDPSALGSATLRKLPGVVERGIRNYEEHMDNVTIANLRFEDLPIAVYSGGDRLRIIANQFVSSGIDDTSDTNGEGAMLIEAFADAAVALGNRFDACGAAGATGSLYAPAMRLRGKDSITTDSNILIAYNDLRGSLGQASIAVAHANLGIGEGLFENLTLRDNYIETNRTGHIAIGGAGTIAAPTLTSRLVGSTLVANNIIVSSVNAIGIQVADTGVVTLAHNTLVGSGLDVRATSGFKVSVIASIFQVPGGTAALVASTNAINALSRENAFFDGTLSACPSWDSTCIASALSAGVSFVSAADLHLAPQSPGQAGASSVVAGAERDYFGRARPAAGATVGAIETLP